MTNITQNFRKQFNRRDFIKITAALGSVMIGGGLFHAIETHRQTVVHDERLLMGTIVSLSVVTDGSSRGQTIIDATYQAMNNLTQYFDYRRSDAEVGQLNRVGELKQPSPELVSLLRRAVYQGEISNGAFDITVLPVLQGISGNRLPSIQDLQLVNYRNILIRDDLVSFKTPGMAVTLDGIAKGRVVDGGVSKLKELGYTNIMVEAGGDLQAEGNDPDGKPWKIGVMNPRAVTSNQWLATFSVTDHAVATSGDYQNSFTSDYALNHIIDPRTGLSPTELASATTIASSVMEADAFSTTLMVMGVEKGLQMVEQLPGVEAFLVTKDLRTFRSSGFPVI